MRNTSLVLFLYCCLMLHWTSAQTLDRKVIASGGGFYSSPSLSVSYTVGETFTSTLLAGNTMLTQGFQQSYVSASSLKLFIQGYYAGNGLMKPVLLNEDVPGADSLSVDTITVSLISPSDLSTLCAVKGLLKTDGTLKVNLPERVLNKTGYLKLNHRNLLETWSATPVVVGFATVYDFSTSASTAYGSNQLALGSGIWAMYNGDLDQDDYIDVFDYPIYESDNFNFRTGYYASDLNGDGYTDPFDYPILEFNSFRFITALHP